MLDFEKVLRFYGVEVNRENDQHVGFCPLPGHDGTQRSPSFSANLKRGIFHCFGCKACGNILDFAVRMEKLDPKSGRNLQHVAFKLKRHFINTDGITRPTKKRSLKEPPHGQQDLFPRPNPTILVNAPLDFALQGLDPAHPYLAERKFTPKTIAHFGVGFCSRGSLKDRIAIPLHNNDGKLIGYAGRVIDDSAISSENLKYKFPSSRERDGTVFEFDKGLFLYNGYRITEPANNLIVVEGFSAVWWLHQTGFGNIVALMGTTVSKQQIDLILQKTTNDGCVWIMPDADHAGLRCSSALLHGISPHRKVRWIKLKRGKPSGYTPEHLRQLLPATLSVEQPPK